MSTTPSPNPNGNPFDVPLNSEIQESQQRQAATPAKDTGYVNPFDEPLASEIADQKHAEAFASGEVTNDVGNTVIVPKDGESFSDTVQRAIQHNKSLTAEQRQTAINKEVATMPAKAAQTLGAAAGIGVAGPALLAVPGEVADFALKHLAGNVLPGMETEAAKQTLIDALPKVAHFAETMGKLGVGAAGLTYLFKSLMGEGKK